MGKHNHVADVDNPIRDQCYETIMFHRQGVADADIAEWLCIDLSDVEAILDDDQAYQRAHGAVPKGLGGGGGKPLPTPDEIAADMARFRARKLAAKAADTVQSQYVHVEYREPRRYRWHKVRRGY